TRVVFAVGDQLYGVNRDGKELAHLYGDEQQQPLKLAIYDDERQRRTWRSYLQPEFVGPLARDDNKVVIAERGWQRSTGAAYYRNREGRPQIAELDTHTGRLHRLGQPPLSDATLLADRSGIPRFATGFNQEAKLFAAWKPTGDAKWNQFPLAGF